MASTSLIRLNYTLVIILAIATILHPLLAAAQEQNATDHPADYDTQHKTGKGSNDKTNNNYYYIYVNGAATAGEDLVAVVLGLFALLAAWFL